MAVSIITDSVACLPEEMAKENAITVVPLEVIYKDKVFRDGIDISPAEFYGLLATSKVLPSTSAPPPKAYLEIYEKIIKEGNDILVVCPSKTLTHVYVSATVAAAMMKEQKPDAVIRVLDSGTAAGAEGFIALDLAQAARKGADVNNLLELAQQIMKEVHVLVYIDTIEYLARSGRVSYILAWANSLLKIKPVIELLPSGKGAVPVGRARSRAKALQRVMEILEERVRDLPLRVVVQHTNALEEAENLKEMVSTKLKCESVYIRDFTPVMGVHTGPGLVGASYSTSVIKY